MQGTAGLPFMTRVTWDLRIQPPSQNTAYWGQSAERLRRGDLQVACYFLTTTVLLSLLALAGGGSGSVADLALVCTVLGAWLLLLQAQPLYHWWRTAIVVAVRLLAAAYLSRPVPCLTSGHDSNAHHKNSSSVLLPLLQLLSDSHALHIPLFALCLPIPLLPQALLTVCVPVAVLWRSAAAGHADCVHSADVEGILKNVLSRWTWLVGSGQNHQAADSKQLLGRSSTLMVFLITLYSTVVCMTLYMSYFALWADIMTWLQDSEPTPHCDQAQLCSEPTTHATTQKQTACGELLARLLFNRQGILGHTSRVCLHVALVNMLCLCCVLFSQLCAQQMLPLLLSPHALRAMYPLVAV